MLLVPRKTNERRLIIRPVVFSPVKPGVCAHIQVNGAGVERHLYPYWMVTHQTVCQGILVFVGLNLQCQLDFRTT